MIRIKKILVAMTILLLGWSAQAAPESRPASIYDTPLSFVNTLGKPFPLSKLKGSAVVMTMTYSSCQFACPRILQRMKNLQKAYQDRGLKARFVVVSFDPARDSPERLKKVHSEDSGMKDWLFLSGKESATRQLSMILGIRYEKNPDDGSISHDNKIVILDPAGAIQKELNGLAPDVSEAF